MKALTFKRYGKSPGIGFDEIPRPAPGPDELLVRVHAAGLNPIDNMIPKGTFKSLLRVDLPATLGSDLAGVVVETGHRVTRFKPGDAIFASAFDSGTGSLAEFTVVSERAAAFKPSNLSFAQAASIPMVGLTAWQALKERAGMEAGQKVFIPAGSGGVGTFAIQLAKHFGAHVSTTVGTGGIELVRDLGADEIIDYGRQRFETVLEDQDVVLATVGGDTVARAIGILRPGGRIVSLVGPPDAAFARSRKLNPVLTLVFRLMSRKTIGLSTRRGIDYTFLFVRPDGHQLGQIGELLQAERVRPVVDTIFPFERAEDALAYLARGRAKGKIVVEME
ncbi:MAG TPA: NADP-dependent oxidoreductase [Variovorax sp.]|nr:NADP-dependent oxidoreductase [Variovorax sp.]